MTKLSIIFSVFLVLPFTLIAQQVTKQERGYFNITELGFFITSNVTKSLSGTDKIKSNAHALSLRNINGFFLNNNLSVGLGVGLDGYTFNQDRYHLDNTFLVFGDFRYYLKNESNTFFLYGDIGTSMAIDDNVEKGLIYNAGAGYKLMPTKRIGLIGSIGYNRQNINNNSNSIKEYYSGCSLKIGMLF
jgi:hypothetical protein